MVYNQGPPGQYVAGNLLWRRELLQSGVGYLVSLSSIDLSEYMRVVSQTVTAEDVIIELISDGGISTLEGRVLTFSGEGIVKLIAYTGERSNPENQVELIFLHY